MCRTRAREPHPVNPDLGAGGSGMSWLKSRSQRVRSSTSGRC
jgi:hypothetical protein